MRPTLLLALFLLLAAPAVAQITIGQTDDFEDGTTQDWRNGRNTPDVSNVATGGPDGAGDAYLQIVADGSFIAGRLVAFNTEQWAGDFTAAGVTTVTLDLNNTGTSDLVVRLWIEGPGGDFVSTDGLFLGAGSGWQAASFSVQPGDLTASGGTDVNATLSDVFRFRVYHGPAASAPGPNVVGELGLDNITAVGASAPSFDLDAQNTSPLSVPRGGSISFDYAISNNTGSPATGNLWYTARRGGTTVAQGVIQSGTVPGGQTVSSSFTQGVPQSAPVGTYAYTLNIGQFPNTVVDAETFTVTVTAGSGSRMPRLAVLPATWPVRDASPWSPVAAGGFPSASSVLPGAFALHAAYPNPTRDATALGFDVPGAAPVTVAVYDVLGREVAVLLDRRVEAGQHTVRFDGAGLARGVYLVRLQAGGASDVRRVTLIR